MVNIVPRTYFLEAISKKTGFSVEDLKTKYDTGDVERKLKVKCPSLDLNTDAI